MLPAANFTLLRALTAYLRRYVSEGAGDIDLVCEQFAVRQPRVRRGSFFFKIFFEILCCSLFCCGSALKPM